MSPLKMTKHISDYNAFPKAKNLIRSYPTYTYWDKTMTKQNKDIQTDATTRSIAALAVLPTGKLRAFNIHVQKDSVAKLELVAFAAALMFYRPHHLLNEERSQQTFNISLCSFLCTLGFIIYLRKGIKTLIFGTKRRK